MVHEADRVASWDQPMFRYLLAVEAARARRGGRPFLVLVADMDGTWTGWAGLAPALARCLRETDLVGWHRTGRRAGALLTEGDTSPAVARLVGDKVLRSLRAGLPAEIGRGLRVRIYRYGVPGARLRFDRVFAARAADTASPAQPGQTEAVAATSLWLTERAVSRHPGN